MVTSPPAHIEAPDAGPLAGPGDPVLISKITAPSLPGWAVPRPRIAALMAESARAPLTTVTGPPGAGKTMSIALWAAARTSPGPCAWMTVDDYDNRPRVFWSYVTAALRAAGVPVAPLAAATASGSEVSHSFLLRLASTLAGQDPPVTLVLDDLHLLTAPAALDGLAYVLRNASPGLRLIAASRMDPLLPLHRYRVGGELCEIRAGDLAFSVPEATLLLAQHGVTLPDSVVESLTRRAEGWAAGLRLAAISLEGHPDPAQFVKEFAAEDSSITGYLVEEVLDAQPAPVRDLLLRTSILSRVSADVADDLMDGSGGDAAGVLTELARTNAFVRSVGHGSYRYHPLFGSVLRLKLRRERPGQVPDLHRRAAHWYWRHGSLAEAVRHAADAGDWQLAARIVVDELAIGQLIDPRGDRPLADEFRCLPPAQPGSGPELLLVAAAMELAAGGPPGGTALSAADAILTRRPAGEDIPARLAAALIRVALSRRTGDHAAAARAAARAEELLPHIPQAQVARHPGVRIEVLAGRGAAELWAGRFDQAAAILGAARDVTTAEASCERLGCLGDLALAEALRGHLTRAAGLADEALAGQPAGVASLALACVHLDRGELREARTQLKLADETLRLRPDPLTDTLARAVAARHALAEGHARPARGMLSRAAAGRPLPSWLGRRIALVESGACAAEGAVQAAVDAAESAAPQSHLDAAVALAQAWLGAGNAPAARRALAAPRAAAAPDYARVEAWLVEARLSYRADDRARGHRSLEQALRLASAEQLRLPFIMERAWIRPVLRRDPGLARAYQPLLEPGVISSRQVATPPPGDAAPLIVEQLSQREREVIRHMSEMMSTAEIAAEMYISVNTVKTHLKSIYRKLAAAHRREAVRRARQLHLV